MNRINKITSVDVVLIVEKCVLCKQNMQHHGEETHRCLSDVKWNKTSSFPKTKI